MDQWALSFKTAWIDEITCLAPPMKHPGFAPECEWRIIHRPQTEDIDQMVYLQKQTLMSRHLPLKYGSADASENSELLPLDEIMVGPSRRKEASKISVTGLVADEKISRVNHKRYAVRYSLSAYIIIHGSFLTAVPDAVSPSDVIPQ